MLYFRFLFCMAAGLFGVCVVLKTLMDVVFANWDVSTDVRRLLDDLARKQRYVMLDDEIKASYQLGSRLATAQSTLQRPPALAAPAGVPYVAAPAAPPAVHRAYSTPVPTPGPR